MRTLNVLTNSGIQNNEGLFHWEMCDKLNFHQNKVLVRTDWDPKFHLQKGYYFDKTASEFLLYHIC